jgi:hypothetical protein
MVLRLIGHDLPISRDVAANLCGDPHTGGFRYGNTTGVAAPRQT